MRTVGSVVGLDPKISRDGNSVTVSSGKVIPTLGGYFDYLEASVTASHIPDNGRLRVYFIDDRLDQMAHPNEVKSVRPKLCTDADASTPRAVYENGLIVAGMLPMSPTAHAARDPQDRALALERLPRVRARPKAQRARAPATHRRGGIQRCRSRASSDRERSSSPVTASASTRFRAAWGQCAMTAPPP